MSLPDLMLVGTLFLNREPKAVLDKNIPITTMISTNQPPEISSPTIKTTANISANNCITHGGRVKLLFCLGILFAKWTINHDKPLISLNFPVSDIWMAEQLKTAFGGSVYEQYDKRHDLYYVVYQLNSRDGALKIKRAADRHKHSLPPGVAEAIRLWFKSNFPPPTLQQKRKLRMKKRARALAGCVDEAVVLVPDAPSHYAHLVG